MKWLWGGFICEGGEKGGWVEAFGTRKSYVRSGNQEDFIGGEVTVWKMLSVRRVQKGFYYMGCRDG